MQWAEIKGQKWGANTAGKQQDVVDGQNTNHCFLYVQNDDRDSMANATVPMRHVRPV